MGKTVSKTPNQDSPEASFVSNGWKERLTHSAGCGNCTLQCSGRSFCNPFKDKLRDYNGIRYTADGFDCALPIAIDSHSTCSFRCMYCFSNYLMRDPNRKEAYCGGVESAYAVGQQNLTVIEKLISGHCDPTSRLGRMHQAIMEVGGNGMRCPVQFGALGDPFDNIERHQGWALEALKVFNKYDQPVRVSTKGGVLLQDPRYLKAIGVRPELYWFAFSTISIDESVLSQIDKDAPSPQDRLKSMKLLTKLGCRTSLRFRPILPGISDSTKKHPKAWRDLIRAAADAGASAISMEFSFVPGNRAPHIDNMWKEIEKVAQIPIVSHYEDTTTAKGTCLRSSRAWKEDLTMAIYEECKRLGCYTFGISDPHFKELNDTGCCCGIKPDDPVFGGWQRNNATMAVVKARQAWEKKVKGDARLVSAADGIPAWSNDVLLTDMVCMAGPKTQYKVAHRTWADKLRLTWNDLEGPRGPLQYFEGVLWPVKRAENGDVLYEYRPYGGRDKSIDVPYLKV